MLAPGLGLRQDSQFLFGLFQTLFSLPPGLTSETSTPHFQPCSRFSLQSESAAVPRPTGLLQLSSPVLPTQGPSEFSAPLHLTHSFSWIVLSGFTEIPSYPSWGLLQLPSPLLIPVKHKWSQRTLVSMILA